MWVGNALWAQINFSTKYQRWYLVEKSLILKQWSTKNQLLDHNSTRNQPTVNQISTIFQHWYFNFKLGWLLVEMWLRSWFLVDHCFKINDFSTKCQRWGWLRLNVDSTLRSWSVPTSLGEHVKHLQQQQAWISCQSCMCVLFPDQLTPAIDSLWSIVSSE